MFEGLKGLECSGLSTEGVRGMEGYKSARYICDGKRWRCIAVGYPAIKEPIPPYIKNLYTERDVTTEDVIALLGPLGALSQMGDKDGA